MEPPSKNMEIKIIVIIIAVVVIVVIRDLRCQQESSSKR